MAVKITHMSRMSFLYTQSGLFKARPLEGRGTYEAISMWCDVMKEFSNLWYDLKHVSNSTYLLLPQKSNLHQLPEQSFTCMQVFTVGMREYVEHTKNKSMQKTGIETHIIDTSITHCKQNSFIVTLPILTVVELA